MKKSLIFWVIFLVSVALKHEEATAEKISYKLFKELSFIKSDDFFKRMYASKFANKPQITATKPNNVIVICPSRLRFQDRQKESFKYIRNWPFNFQMF